MALLDYTTYADIRAVLGVSEDDLEDGPLSLEVYANGLEMELEDIDTSLPSAFITVKAIPENTRNDEQRRFLQAAQLFATYAVAKQLGSGLPMFGAKDIGDGKATTTRFSDSPYKQTMIKVAEGYDRFRNRLEDAFAKLNASSTTVSVPVFFRAVGAAIDPVTGS